MLWFQSTYKYFIMEMTKNVKNWEIGTTPESLASIHQDEINIAIYERDKSSLVSEINNLLEQNIEFRGNGDIDTIVDQIKEIIDPNKYSLVIQDIKELLHHFKEVAKVKKFRLLLATINTNMCRRFHTDINDLRMLCTYSGPGTLWLPEDNINQKKLDASAENKDIVIDERKIQQAKTGAVLILKGALYPEEGTRAIVHRSPTIEESGEKRLLLRIDTSESLIFQ